MVAPFEPPLGRSWVTQRPFKSILLHQNTTNLLTPKKPRFASSVVSKQTRCSHGVRLAAGAAGGFWVEEWKMSRFGSKTQPFLNSIYTTRKYRVFILLSFARMISGAQKKNNSRKTFGISPYIFGHQDERWCWGVTCGHRIFEPSNRTTQVTIFWCGTVDNSFEQRLNC